MDEVLGDWLQGTVVVIWNPHSGTLAIFVVSQPP